jgi:hypothetical protein
MTFIERYNLCLVNNTFKTTEGSTCLNVALNCERNIVTINGVMFT